MPSKKRKLSETVTVEQEEAGDDVELMEVGDEPRLTETKPRKKKEKPFDVKTFRKSLKGTDFIFGRYTSYCRGILPQFKHFSFQKSSVSLESPPKIQQSLTHIWQIKGPC